MICKSCGTKLEVESGACPNCGTNIPPKDGGNGFWDMVSGEPQKQQPTPPIDNRPKSALSLYAICISCILTLACNIVAFVILSKVNSEFDAAMQKMDGIATQVQASIGTLDTNTKEISDKIDELALMSTSSEPNEPVEEVLGIIFEHEVEQYIGLPIIQFKIVDGVTTVVWEKQDANGFWHVVEFDDGKNEQYGFELLDNPENNEYGLIAGSISEETAGLYRFTMLQESGEVVFTGILPLQISNIVEDTAEVIEETTTVEVETDTPSETEGTLD